MSIELLAVGTLVLLVGLLAFEAAVRSTTFGMILVLGLWYWYDLTDIRPAVFAGSIQIIDTDVIFPLLGVAAVARLSRGARFRWPQVAILLLGALTLFSIYEGARQFGVAATVNEARKFIYLASGLLYFSTAEGDDAMFDRWAKVWCAFALAWLPILVLRWASLIGGHPDTTIFLRVVDTFVALPLVQAALITLPVAAVAWMRTRRAPWLLLMALPLLVATIALTHRTLWIVLIVCVAILIASTRVLRRRTLILLTLVSLSTSGIVVVIADTFVEERQDIDQALSENPAPRIATNTNTFKWRYIGWVGLIDDFEPTLKNFVVGQPHGRGWSRLVAGQRVEVSPHNFYLETFLRTGVPGLLLFLSLYAWTFRRWFRSPRPWRIEERPIPLLNRSTALALLTSQLLFFLTSRITDPQYVLLGLLIARASYYSPLSLGPRSPLATTIRGAGDMQIAPSRDVRRGSTEDLNA